MFEGVRPPQLRVACDVVFHFTLHGIEWVERSCVNRSKLPFKKWLKVTSKRYTGATLLCYIVRVILVCIIWPVFWLDIH